MSWRAVFLGILLKCIDGMGCWDVFFGQFEGSITSSVLERENNEEQVAFMPLAPMGAFYSFDGFIHDSLVKISGSVPVVGPSPHASLVYKGFFGSSVEWMPAITTFSVDYSYSVASGATDTTTRTE